MKSRSQTALFLLCAIGLILIIAMRSRLGSMAVNLSESADETNTSDSSHSDSEAAQLLARLKFVAKCLEDFAKIELGMRRTDVEKLFFRDGGLVAVNEGRYIHPELPYFKIDVKYERLDPSEDDPENASAKYRDIVVKVSKPYIEHPYSD